MKNKCLFPLICLLALSSCVPARKKIGPNGIKAIQLGDPIPKEGTPKLARIPLRDSVMEEGEYAWRAVLMEYDEGLVYLEEDFYGSGNLSRLRVETPELRVKNGLRVGSSVADLAEKSRTWYITPLRDYQLFDFYSRTFPRLHFIVDDPGRNMDDEDWEAYKMGQFDPLARIVAIVVL